MAGLLDIFGTGGADTMGLLGMSPADIQRNRDDAQAQALYALAGRLFQGGNTGQSIAEGLQAGQRAYKGGMQETLQGQLQNVQLADMIRKRQLEQQALAEQKRIQTVLGQGMTPEVQARPSQMVEEDGRYIGETPAVEARAAGFDLARIAPQLMGSPEGRKTLSELVAAQKAMAGETTSLAEGAKLIRVNPITGKVETVAEGEPKRVPLQSDIEKYEFAKKNDNYKGSFTQFLLDEARAKATTINMPSGEERKASLFQQQMQSASNVIGSLGPVDMTNKTNQLAFKGAGGIGNIAVDPKIQQYKQAADQWSEAFLRVKTGAAATPSEVELNNKTYFPVFGDDAATVKQKERMRKQAEQDMGIVAGRAEKTPKTPSPKIDESIDLAALARAELARRKKEAGG
jgi:hypothetical protein